MQNIDVLTLAPGPIWSDIAEEEPCQHVIWLRSLYGKGTLLPFLEGLHGLP